jgi:hypothetical protein
MNLELKALEENIRIMQEKVHQVNEHINTLPPTEQMTKILENMHVYNQVEEMKIKTE